MTELIVRNEPAIRMGFFVGIFLAVALVELVAPRRALTASKKTRWFGNIGIVAINTFLLRILFPAGAVGISIWVGRQGWGIFNLAEWPFWLEIVLTVIILDFVIYMQHVMFHAVPALWRLHMMHHADLDIDLTTGTRFHPIEIIISIGIKAGAIIILGAPPVGVIIFEIILNGTAMFNHGNFFIPLGVDRVLRLLVDFQMGHEPDKLLQRIMARIVPGPEVNRGSDTCLVSLISWRAEGMSDARWKRLCVSHETQMFIIKHMIESGA